MWSSDIAILAGDGNTQAEEQGEEGKTWIIG